MTPRICPICGRAFAPQTSAHKYCSYACKRAVSNAANRQWREKTKNKTGTAESLLPRKCEICGKLFEPRCWRQKNCRSVECMRARNKINKANQRRRESSCIVCGKPFELFESSTKKTCSAACRAALAVTTTQSHAAAVGATGGRPLTNARPTPTTNRSTPDGTDFYTLQTLCPEFPSWDCPQMDPFTNRMEPAVWIDTPVAVAPRTRRAA